MRPVPCTFLVLSLFPELNEWKNVCISISDQVVMNVIWWNHDWETNPEQRWATVESLEDLSLAPCLLRQRISSLAACSQTAAMTRIVPLSSNSLFSHFDTQLKRKYLLEIHWDDILFGNQIWRKIWRYSKLPPFSWVEKLFSFQFVSVDCCKYILVDTELLIVNQDIRWVKRALKEYNLGSRPLMRPIALLVSGKLYRIQRTLPGSSFSANYLEIILSDPKTYGENRSIFLKCIALHHSSLNSLLFTTCTTL